jgi:hypothetical protein
MKRATTKAALFLAKPIKRSSLAEQEDLPGPAANVRAVYIIDFGTIAKAITILIRSPGFFIVQVEGVYTKRRQRMQLTWL